MSDDRIDPELLAAFLDGAATPAEREAVLRTLASSRVAYDAFIEASAIHRELTGEAGGALPGGASPAPQQTTGAPAAPVGGAPPQRSSRWLRPRYVAPVLLAAGVAAVLITRSVAPGRPDQGGMIQLVEATSLTRPTGSGALARTLGDTWDQPPWSIARGSEPLAASHALAFKTGARYAQYELAAHAADTAAAMRAADAIASLLSNTDGGAPFAASFRSFTRAPDFGGRTQRAAAAGRLRELVGAGDWFDIGAWTETARIATVAGRADFFDATGPGIAELRRIAQAHAGASQPGRADWAPVLDALAVFLTDRVWTPNDMPAAGSAIRTAMVAAAR